MRKLGSISANSSVPSKSTNKLCTHARNSDHSVAAAIFANGTYFVDTPRTVIRWDATIAENARTTKIIYILLSDLSKINRNLKDNCKYLRGSRKCVQEVTEIIQGTHLTG
jgi:hypothetical protein